MTLQSSYRNALLFVVLAAIWGSAFTAIKIGLDYFPPVMYAAFRYELATPIMIGYMLVSADRWRPRTTGEWLNIVASGVFIYAGYHAFLFVGQQYTTSTVAAIIGNTESRRTTGSGWVMG